MFIVMIRAGLQPLLHPKKVCGTYEKTTVEQLRIFKIEKGEWVVVLGRGFAVIQTRIPYTAYYFIL